ncbi:15229_t:CDS:2 [Cetraspora pellucida]|uniref:15229_t:CDS:1 n=1 Tax=Cetraspora pellucida TaxID=1433469 RepID=A0ACA9LY08_9GLOM|nr:15229_t:CDS:2 [Cetraspora pellucida]
MSNALEIKELKKKHNEQNRQLNKLIMESSQSSSSSQQIFEFNSVPQQQEIMFNISNTLNSSQAVNVPKGANANCGANLIVPNFLPPQAEGVIPINATNQYNSNNINNLFDFQLYKNVSNALATSSDSTTNFHDNNELNESDSKRRRTMDNNESKESNSKRRRTMANTKTRSSTLPSSNVNVRKNVRQASMPITLDTSIIQAENSFLWNLFNHHSHENASNPLTTSYGSIIDYRGSQQISPKLDAEQTSPRPDGEQTSPQSNVELTSSQPIIVDDSNLDLFISSILQEFDFS